MDRRKGRTFRHRWLRPMEWSKLLYETVGPRYPTLSLIGAILLGAILFGGAWWLMGKQYERDHPAAPKPVALKVQDKPQTLVGGDLGVSADFKQHKGGLVVELEQTFDPLTGPPASVELDNVFRVEGGVLTATPEFHRPDGTFMYPRGILQNAELGNGQLYFKSPQSWWIINNDGRGEAWIVFGWGDRPGGRVPIKPGDWEISVVISVGAKEFTKKVRCSWRGSGSIEIKPYL